MQKLNFSIVINASKEKVWNTMLEDKTYRIWTEVFSKGSHFIGDWRKGSKILFLGFPILDSIMGNLDIKSSIKLLSISEFFGVNNHSGP